MRGDPVGYPYLGIKISGCGYIGFKIGGYWWFWGQKLAIICVCESNPLSENVIGTKMRRLSEWVTPFPLYRPTFWKPGAPENTTFRRKNSLFQIICKLAWIQKYERIKKIGIHWHFLNMNSEHVSSKNKFYTAYGGRTGPPKVTLKVGTVYIKRMHFELILPVLHNSFNFWDRLPNLGVNENI